MKSAWRWRLASVWADWPPSFTLTRRRPKPFVNVATPISTQQLLRRTDSSLFLSARPYAGYTAQACKLRDEWAEFGNRASLFGISTDSLESHRSFIELNLLPFPLISDTQKSIVRAYGVWMEEPEGGKGDQFRTERTTFVIAPAGKIKTILRKVDPYTHDRLLLEALYS